MSLPLLAVGLLVLLLVVARAGDRRRARALEDAWSHTLSPAGNEVLHYLELAVREHRVGLEVLERAARARDVDRLGRAVDVVEGFAPALREGLTAVKGMSRVVSALVPMAPLRILAWKAWELRSLASLGLVLHVFLVAAVERVRLRAWLISRALVVALLWLKRASTGMAGRPEDWHAIERAAQDLAVVGDEAEQTYRSVVASLDAVAGSQPADSVASVGRSRQ